MTSPGLSLEDSIVTMTKPLPIIYCCQVEEKDEERKFYQSEGQVLHEHKGGAYNQDLGG